MSHTVTDSSIIIKAIERAVKDELARILEEETAAAIKRVHERMRNAADQLALNMLQHYDVQRAGPNIVITVKKELGNG